MEYIALLFPGQGSNFIGMGKSLFDEYLQVRQTFEEANDVLGYDVGKMCFEGTATELNRADSALVAILTVSVAAYRAFIGETCVRPKFMAGHSLGEYSALTCSGAINFADALKIVRYRGLLAQELADECGGYMTVISSIRSHIVAKECEKLSNMGKVVDVTCYNTPEQVVVAGESEAVMLLEDTISEMGGQITPLFASPPFHSRLMEPVSRKLNAELRRYTYNCLQYPVISNVYAKPYRSAGEIINNLSMQMSHPVKWDATIRYLYENNVSVTVELGTNAIMTNLVKENTGDIRSYSFAHKDERQSLFKKSEKQGFSSIAPKGVLRSDVSLITMCLAEAVSTRNRNWNEQKYYEGVIEPYERIEKLQLKLKKTGENPSREQMKEALQMLYSVFEVKGVPNGERVCRIRDIADFTGNSHILPELGFGIS